MESWCLCFRGAAQCFFFSMDEVAGGDTKAAFRWEFKTFQQPPFNTVFMTLLSITLYIHLYGQGCS